MAMPSPRPAAAAAKRAHVNMMTDTIVANLPAPALRSVVRALLTLHPDVTPTLEAEAKHLLLRDAGSSAPSDVQARVRCMLGCGLVFESLPLLTALVERAAAEGEEDGLAVAVDGDVVQAATAVQKMLVTAAGAREMADGERALVRGLLEGLRRCRTACGEAGRAFPFERSAAAVAAFFEPEESGRARRIEVAPLAVEVAERIETFEVGGRAVPRLFSGLWQLSSPAWGTAPQAKVVEQFEKYVSSGYTAYDMADHYGDAEIVFGSFRSACSDPEMIFAATKYCVFSPMTVNEEVVRGNVSERCRRLKSEKVDLLQFHWQNYSDPQYIQALKLLQADTRVSNLGLCNFDTEHMEIVLREGIDIKTNQFSLIDSRPIFKMAAVCEKYGVKLLTYGTLCGGFLAEKWLDKPEPELFSSDITPSQRKYFEAILSWGGWQLFQTLLQTLSTIAAKHSVSVSNVATRWVLDFSYVGAVIVGSRMGISQRADENFAAYGWRLDDGDREAIEEVLAKSRRAEMFEAMGDCGGEYR
ncbi:Aldo keto reductase [Neofusicoccum parvum]|uniref:Aldo keto reductase n=1 Tax=Neofusicoccum parvum TaxID=310453 RepID=A0ACB5SCF3_9PEZI|nr:Aldo keto reductase [Neofusicoccum parvum]